MNSTRKYLLVEPKVKAIAPNIALMKWARWNETNDFEYQYVRGMVEPKITPDAILMSCIFTYYSKVYEKTIDFYLNKFPEAKITVGGAFPSLNPKWFNKWNGAVTVHKGLCNEIESLTPKFNVDIQSEDKNPYPRDKIVLYASRGCSNKCRYCAVPKLEGGMKPFKSISGMLNDANMPYASSVVLFDNNFTAHEHFDNIVDELIEFGLPVDIHGLHVDSFTRHHAKKFSKLNWAAQGKNGTSYLRFSFDKKKYAKNIHRALRYVVDENVKANFFCYMLYNWLDTPDDFWNRIQIIQQIVDDVGEAIYLFPQRYEPLIAFERNNHIGKHWDENLIKGISRLYTQIHGFIPITRSRNVYEWIGHTKDEFYENANKMGADVNYRLKKKPYVTPNKRWGMEFHPIAGIFPMMGAEEFEGLKSDIERNGQLEPIWIHEGKIIDGRNRYLACQKLGIKPRYRKWKPVGDVELVDFVISLNLKRRHLNTSQKALVAVDALPYYEQLAKIRQKLSRGRGKKGVAKMPQVFQGRSRDVAAKVFGVSGRYVGYSKQIIQNDLNLAQEIRDGKKTITEALNQIKKADKISKIKEGGKYYRAKSGIKIVCADFYQWCNQNVKDCSIDLVITEPPIAKKDLPLWEKLTEVSARVLKPSSFLVAFCGHRYIDKVIQALSKHLNYYWLHSTNTGRNRNQPNNFGIYDKWKPVLVYYKPPFERDRISKDFLNGSLEHQPEYANAESYFIEMLCPPMGMILDPMMGKGGVLKSSRMLKRKAIGIDIDSSLVEKVNAQIFHSKKLIK